MWLYSKQQNPLKSISVAAGTAQGAKGLDIRLGEETSSTTVTRVDSDKPLHELKRLEKQVAWTKLAERTQMSQ